MSSVLDRLAKLVADRPGEASGKASADGAGASHTGAGLLSCAHQSCRGDGKWLHQEYWNPRSGPASTPSSPIGASPPIPSSWTSCNGTWRAAASASGWTARRSSRASDWSQRVRRGIDASKAFVYVLTPESAVSPECLRELEAAVELHRLVVPVVLRDVDPKILPEALTKPNWVYFSPGHDPSRGLDELIQALEEDLSWRDEHTRLGVRTKEWEDSKHDKSFLLRGSDLRTGEEWLGTAAAHPRTPPTAGQAAFIVASRQGRGPRSAHLAGRPQRRAWSSLWPWPRSPSCSGTRRGTRRSWPTAGRSRRRPPPTFPPNPQQSLRLALNATTINAGGPAQQALRLAVADDRQRMVIQSGAGAATVAAWNPAMNQMAMTGPRDTVELWNTVTGRVTRVLDAAHASSGSDAVSGLLYDTDGTRLAAVTSTGVRLPLGYFRRRRRDARAGRAAQSPCPGQRSRRDGRLVHAGLRRVGRRGRR